MKPIGIYVRVSRKGEREDERFHSPREQRERAEALVRAKGLTPGPVFEDIDVSGATAPAKRPAMSELLRAVEAGELGGIAAFSLDRLSREPAHGDTLVKRVTKAGGIVLTPDIPDAIDSPTGEFTFGMLLQVAKLYRSQAGARFASAKERSIRAGIPVGPLPIGLRAGKNRKAERDPKTWRVVRELFERRQDGEGYTALADFLEDKTGDVWTRQGVAAVLKNPVYYTGRLEYGDIVSDVSFEPVVDAPLWHAVQNATPKPRAPRSKNGKWLLTGLVRCEGCGNALIPWTGARRRRRDPRRGKMDWVEVPNPSRRYRCTTRGCPAPAAVDAKRIERWVVARTFELDDELALRSDAPDLSALEAAVELAQRRLDQVMAPEARDALGSLWAADVKARRAELDDALAELGDARQVAGVPVSKVRLRDVWDKMKPADRRSSLSLFWKAIRVGRRNGKGTPLVFVARGPHAEVEVEIPDKGVNH